MVKSSCRGWGRDDEPADRRSGIFRRSGMDELDVPRATLHAFSLFQVFVVLVGVSVWMVREGLAALETAALSMTARTSNCR